MKKSVFITPLFIALIAIDSDAQVSEAPEILVKDNVRRPIVDAPPNFDRRQVDLTTPANPFLKIERFLQKPFRQGGITDKTIERK
jgi:hypothetical protein